MLMSLDKPCLLSFVLWGLKLFGLFVCAARPAYMSKITKSVYSIGWRYSLTARHSFASFMLCDSALVFFREAVIAVTHINPTVWSGLAHSLSLLNCMHLFDSLFSFSALLSILFSALFSSPLSLSSHSLTYAILAFRMPPLFALLLLGLGEGERRCEERAVGEWVCCNLGSFFMLVWGSWCRWLLPAWPVHGRFFSWHPWPSSIFHSLR